MANQVLSATIPENYSMLKELGQGCYGQVIKCLKRDTEETVAVKILKQRHSRHRKIAEVRTLEKLRCLDPDKNNIVRCHEWFHRNNQTFMVFEVLDMSLFDYMYRIRRAPLPFNGLRTIIKDVATALNALKNVGLIHTDLKLDNVMLVDHQRQPYRVKLIDFGLTLQNSEARPGIAVQPLWHRSPEIILGLPFTEAIDVWSLGSMVGEMLLGLPLFPGRHEYDVLRYIIDLLGKPPKRLLNGGMNTELFYNGRRKYLVFMHWTFKTPQEYYTETGIQPRETRKHSYSSLDELKTWSLHKGNRADAADRSACVDLLREMLQLDPRDRITPSKILAHPFISGSYLNSSSSSEYETAASETSQAVSNSNDTAETDDKADDRCPTPLPSGVILVKPAEKTTKQSSPVRYETAASEISQAVSNSNDTAETGDKADDSPQDVQNEVNDCPKTKDDTSLILEPVSEHDPSCDSGLVLESITSNVKASPAPDSVTVSIKPVPPKSHVEAPDSVLDEASSHTSEVSKPEKKKKKKGVRRFFSTLKRAFFCCFHLPEDDDE